MDDLLQIGFAELAQQSLHQSAAHDEITLAITKLLALLKVYPLLDGETIRVAHYTSATVAKKFIQDSSLLRLSAPFTMNDTWEGRTLYEYLSIKSFNKSPSPLVPFIGCFSFALKSLNQFRLYGKTDGQESSGISFELKDTFFADGMTLAGPAGSLTKHNEKLTLFRCVYVNPGKKTFVGVAQIDRHTLACHKGMKHDKLPEYKIRMGRLEYLVSQQFEIIQQEVSTLNEQQITELAPWLAQLTPLIKHADYHDEQECRLVRILNTNNLPNGVTITSKDDRRPHTLLTPYIEYKTPFLANVKEIVVGTNSINRELVHYHATQDYPTIHITLHNSPHKE